MDNCFGTEGVLIYMHLMARFQEVPNTIPNKGIRRNGPKVLICDADYKSKSTTTNVIYNKVLTRLRGQLNELESRETEDMSQPPNTELVSPTLHLIGFEVDEISAKKASGHLLITENCCQPFKVLHGGVSALIAEGLASLGAHVASGFKRVAGIHLSINHLKSAQLGDFVVAEATPTTVGRTIQVWDVHLSKCDVSKPETKTLIASSKVTIICNLPVPESAKEATENLKNNAKL